MEKRERRPVTKPESARGMPSLGLGDQSGARRSRGGTAPQSESARGMPSLGLGDQSETRRSRGGTAPQPAPAPSRLPAATPPASPPAQRLTWRWILGIIVLGMVLMALDPIAGVIMGRGTNAFGNASFVVFALATCLAAFKLRLAPRYVVVVLMVVAVVFFVPRHFLGEIFYESVLQVLNSHTDPTQRIFFADYDQLDPALNECGYCPSHLVGAEDMEDIAGIFLFAGILLTGIGALFRLLGRSSAPTPVPASAVPAPASGRQGPASDVPQPSDRSGGIGRLDRIDRWAIIVWVLGPLIGMPSFLAALILTQLSDIGYLEPDPSQLKWRVAASLMVALGFAVFVSAAMVPIGCVLFIYGPPGSRRRRLLLGILSLLQVFRWVRINKPVNFLIHNLPVELVGIGLFVFLFHLMFGSILLYGVGPLVAVTTGDFTIVDFVGHYDDYPGWFKISEDISNLWPLFVVAGIGVWVLDNSRRIAFVAAVLALLLKPFNTKGGGGGSSSSSSSDSTEPAQFQFSPSAQMIQAQRSGGGSGSGGGGKK